MPDGVPDDGAHESISDMLNQCVSGGQCDGSSGELAGACTEVQHHGESGSEPVVGVAGSEPVVGVAGGEPAVDVAGSEPVIGVTGIDPEVGSNVPECDGGHDGEVNMSVLEAELKDVWLDIIEAELACTADACTTGAHDVNTVSSEAHSGDSGDDSRVVMHMDTRHYKKSGVNGKKHETPYSKLAAKARELLILLSWLLELRKYLQRGVKP